MVAANLNEDVLATACQFLTDVSDVLSFSLTCSSLRPIAIRRLLSMRLIPLRRGASICKFHSFLFADAPARTPYIRAIHVDWNPDALPLKRIHPGEPGEASLLVDILTSCPNIETISVMIYSNDPPPIVRAISTLPNLREFFTHGWSTEAGPALLSTIHAPLRVLRFLEFDNSLPQWHYGRWWNPTTLECVLRDLAPTLEELEVCALTVDPNKMQVPEGMNSLPPIASAAQYPAVRSLTVGRLVGSPLLGPLQHLFPALCGSLSIWQSVIYLPDDTESDVRDANKLVQRNDDDGDPARPQAWKKLDRLACEPKIFYTLALRCPIRLVMLRNISTKTRHFVTDALRENPVPRLQLLLALDGGLGVLEGLLPAELVGTLTHLTLILQYMNEVHPRGEGELDAPHPLAHVPWLDLFDRTLSVLQPLHRLTHLRLVISANVLHFEYFPAAYSDEFVRAVRGPAFDFAGTASVLARSLPSLRYFLLTTEGRLSDTRGVYDEWHAARGWRVGAWREQVAGPAENAPGTPLGGGGEPVLVELADAVVETIVWTEELFVSEAEEDSLRRNRL